MVIPPHWYTSPPRIKSFTALILGLVSFVLPPTAIAQSEPVWSVDLIRTLPGMQDEYLRNIEANWAGARSMAKERGIILSYQALAAEPDSTRRWDIILMTEYTDSTAWAAREDEFRAIFESPEFARLQMDTPSAELREFVAGGVTMRGVAPPAMPVYDTGARWSPDASHILFYTYRHDPDGAELYRINPDGTGLTRLTDTYHNEWWSDYSPDGALIYTSSDFEKDERFGGSEIFIMESGGSDLRRLTPDTGEGIFNTQPRPSPDGSQILYGTDQIATKVDAEIYLVNADGSGRQNLTNHPALDRFAAWSPDGSKIVFTSDRDGDNDVYIMNRDGSEVTRLTDSSADDIQPDFSPDGTSIVFVSERDGNPELYTMHADGSNLKRLTFSDARDGLPAWSPHGDLIAFTTYRHGDGDKGDIYVISIDGTGERRLTAR